MADSDERQGAPGRGIDAELTAMLRVPVNAVPVGRCVQMVVHRALDDTVRRLLIDRLGARLPDMSDDPPAALGVDVRVTVTRHAAYCWLVTAHWRDDIPAVTPANQVRAAFRATLRALTV